MDFLAEASICFLTKQSLMVLRLYTQSRRSTWADITDALLCLLLPLAIVLVIV